MSSSQPLISIIVPVYNSEAYLCQCLDSIVTQTLRGIETILFKLGSNDLNKTFREIANPILGSR